MFIEEYEHRMAVVDTKQLDEVVPNLQPGWGGDQFVVGESEMFSTVCSGNIGTAVLLRCKR